MGQFLLYASHQPRNQSVHASFPVPSSQFVRLRSEWNPKAGSPSFRQETFCMRSGGYAQAICANIPEPAARSWSDISASGSYWSNEDARQSRNKECTWVKRGSLTHVLVKRIKLQQMHGVFPYVFSIFEKMTTSPKPLDAKRPPQISCSGQRTRSELSQRTHLDGMLVQEYHGARRQLREGLG